MPILFLIPKFFETDTDTFFRYQFFSKPIPILFSIPKIFETNTDTFFDTKNFRNQYRYHQNNWKSFETEKFRNQNVTLCGAGDILVPMPVLYNCVLSHLLIWGRITQVAIYFLNLICESGLVGNVSIYSVCPRVSRPQFYNGIYGHCLFVTHLTHLREHLNIIVGIANVVQSHLTINN